MLRELDHVFCVVRKHLAANSVPEVEDEAVLLVVDRLPVAIPETLEGVLGQGDVGSHDATFDSFGAMIFPFLVLIAPIANDAIGGDSSSSAIISASSM